MGDCWNTATRDRGYELNVRGVMQEKIRADEDK